MSGDDADSDTKHASMIIFVLLLIGVPFSLIVFWGLYAHVHVTTSAVLFIVSFLSLIALVYLIFSMVPGTKFNGWIRSLCVVACVSVGTTSGSGVLLALQLSN